MWRSPAFAAAPAADGSTRLGRFHAHYGEDVLAAARAGEGARARDLAETWIRRNRPRNDDAWHPYAVATRAGNWIAALTLVPELATSRVSESLWRQLGRLEANVEDDVLGNHLIRNARALALGGAAFGDGRLTRRALELLHREVNEQVLPDGGHYERSPAYHSVVLRDLLEVQAVAPQPWLDEPIERMRRFAAALARPDGTPALFNDGWLGLAPALELPETPQGVAVFPDSGFAVVRSGRLWLAFRCGPLAPAFLPAHAHADALSFQLWWDGRPVVVDPATNTYERGADRDWYRSTAAHSTIRIDGREQFQPWGVFRSGPLPEVKLLRADEQGFEASVQIGRTVRHVRRIEWNATEVLVRDRVEPSGRHRVESRIVWAPDPPPGVELDSLVEGQAVAEEPGWVSERLGDRSPTRVSIVCAELELPAELGWRIRLS